jgi:putative transposase
MGHSRQAYYQGRRREADHLANAQAVVELVREQRMRQPRIGTRKLHYLLQEPLQRQGIGLGRDAMFDVLRNARLLGSWCTTPTGVSSTARRITKPCTSATE